MPALNNTQRQYALQSGHVYLVRRLFGLCATRQLGKLLILFALCAIHSQGWAQSVTPEVTSVQNPERSASSEPPASAPEPTASAPESPARVPTNPRVPLEPNSTSSLCAAGSQLDVGLKPALPPMQFKDLGPLGEDLLHALLAQLCTSPTVVATLSESCAVTTTETLQPALARDLLHIPARALGPQLQALQAEQRLAVELLSALAQQLDPAALAQHLSNSLGYSASGICAEPKVAVGDPLGVAVLAIWTVSQANASGVDGPSLTARLVDVLTQLSGGHPEQYFTPAQVQAVARVGAQLHVAHQTYVKAQTLQAGKQLLQAELDLAQAALVLGRSQAVNWAANTAATLNAALHADINALALALSQSLGAHAQLDTEVIDAAVNLQRLVQAKSQKDAEAILRNLVLGLGPWSDKWLVKASAGVPQLKSGNLKLVGDGQLGYNEGAWGLVGGGGTRVIEFVAPDSLIDTVRFYGSFEGWYGLRLSERGTLELRGSFDVTVQDSESSFNDDAAASTIYSTEDSALMRGGALLGVRYEAEHVAVGAWLGAGRQLQSYDVLNSIIADEITTQGQNLTSSSTVAQARFRFESTLVPRYLSIRLAVDARLYSLAKVTEQIDSTADAPFVVVDESTQQREVSGRAFLALERLRLFGFVPEAGVGIDYYHFTSANEPAQSATIPVYSAGIRRTTF